MAKEKSGQASAIEAIESWYDDAEELLLRISDASNWRGRLSTMRKPERWIEQAGDKATKKEIAKARHDAAAHADAYADTIVAQAEQMQSEATALAKRFQYDWLAAYYLELRNIEIEGLPSQRSTVVPLQVVTQRIAFWARTLGDAQQTNRTLNCKEVSDSIDFEKWIPQTIEKLQERLLLERLTITKSSATKNRGPGGGGRRKRKGEPTRNKEKMAAALRQWHGYDAESLSCTNIAPISYDKLAELSKTRKGKAQTKFFEWWLGDNEAYKLLCERGNPKALALAIAKLSHNETKRLLELTANAHADAKAKRPDDIDD